MNDTETFIETDYQTLEGLKTHPLWLKLTEKQAKFLEQYLRTGDKVASAFAAYDTQSRASAHALAHTMLTSYEGRTLVGLYKGYVVRGTHVSRSELLARISDRLRSLDISTAEFRNLCSIYADVKKWRSTKQKRGTALLGVDPEDLSDQKGLMQLVQQYENERGNTKTRRSSDEEDEEQG